MRHVTAVAALLKRDQIRVAQGRGFRLQRLVVGVGAVLIQYLELADGHFVVGRGQAGIRGHHDGVTPQCRSHGCIDHRAADLPAGKNHGRNTLGLEYFVEVGAVESVLTNGLNNCPLTIVSFPDSTARHPLQFP